MNEETLLLLLKRLTSQLVEHFDEKNRLSRREDFADRVAEGAWEGLVFMLRQSLAKEDFVVLKDVGTFRREKGGVSFEPAASLVQAAGLRAPAPEAYEEQARRALFYLHEATELLRCIPYDVKVRAEEGARQEARVEDSARERLRKFFADFGTETHHNLAPLARSSVNLLDSQVRRLESGQGTSSGVTNGSGMNTAANGTVSWESPDPPQVAGDYKTTEATGDESGSGGAHTTSDSGNIDDFI